MAKRKQMEAIKDTWTSFNQNYEEKQPKRKGKWIHENKDLLFGSITYKAKLLGTVDCEVCKDKETVESSIKELKKKGGKLKEVEISISVRSLIITEVKSKMHICKHKLQKIAYCSDDGASGNKIFSFIVKKGDDLFQCYCLDTQGCAHTITLTVGQAFALAYERYQEAKSASETFVGEMKKIKAKKGKEDYVKKLAEIHQNPEYNNEESDLLPDLSHSRMGRRPSSNQLYEQWQQLNDTLKVFRDDDLPNFQSDVSDFDQAFESIQNEIEEWSKAKSPYQSDLEVHNALKEFEDVLGPSDSSTQLTDSQTKLPQFAEDDELTEL